MPFKFQCCLLSISGFGGDYLLLVTVAKIFCDLAMVKKPGVLLEF